MKGTRKILVSSFIMIIACCLLFAGTTFAWFSDSVSSNNNIITAGTLDIELEYYDSVANDWVEVEEDTALLSASDLWEPGFTKVVYFKVTNAGTLGLKYSFNMSITEETAAVNVYGKSFKLSDYLVFSGDFGLTEHKLLTKDELPTTYYNLAKRNNLVSGVELAAGSVEYGYLVITMPTTVGNEANTKPGTKAPSINVGFDLLASQLNGEANGGEADVPVASATQLAVLPELTANEIVKLNSDSLEDVVLETAYEFSALDTAEHAQNSYYANWIADFVVTFDGDVPAGALGLVGQYDMATPDQWYDGSWMAYENTKDYAAGESLRLLEEFSKEMNNGKNVTINYTELCSKVKDFNCGAYDTNNILAGITMKVELRLYETYDKAEAGTANKETGKYITLATYEYTFGNEESVPTITVKNSAELVDTLDAIYSNAEYYNKDVVIKMKAGEYEGNIEIKQYAKTYHENGEAAIPANGDHYYLTFVGEQGTKFTGNVTVVGYGYSNGGFANANSHTTFKNITFDATNSADESKVEDSTVVYVKSGAANVTFEGCTFENATHVTLGENGPESGVGHVTFKGCVFNDGGCLSGYFAQLTVSNCYVNGARNGFINQQKGAKILVENSVINAGRYFIRTSNSDTTVTVNDCDIKVYTSEGTNHLVWFRGSNESVTFNNCTIASGYTTNGVDANSTLTIN